MCGVVCENALYSEFAVLWRGYCTHMLNPTVISADFLSTLLIPADSVFSGVGIRMPAGNAALIRSMFLRTMCLGRLEWALC